MIPAGALALTRLPRCGADSPAGRPGGACPACSTRAGSGPARPSSSGPPQRTSLRPRSPNMSVAGNSEPASTRLPWPTIGDPVDRGWLAGGSGEFGDELRGVDCAEAGDQVVSALGVEARHDVGLAVA